MSYLEQFWKRPESSLEKVWEIKRKKFLPILFFSNGLRGVDIKNKFNIHFSLDCLKRVRVKTKSLKSKKIKIKKAETRRW